MLFVFLGVSVNPPAEVLFSARWPSGSQAEGFLWSPNISIPESCLNSLENVQDICFL